MSRRLAIPVLALMLGIGACAGEADSVAGTEGKTPDPVAGRWAELLAALPDTQEARDGIYLQDFEMVRQTIGLDVPGPEATDTEFFEYAMTLTMGPATSEQDGPVTSRSPHVFLNPMSLNADLMLRDGYRYGWQNAFGFDLLDVDRDALIGAGEDQSIVWRGTFDPEKSARAIEADPVWSQDALPIVSGGLEYVCWGDDPGRLILERRDEAVRPLGRGGCLGVYDDIAFRSYGQPQMEAMLGAYRGRSRSLADVEALTLAATALEGANTYAAFLASNVNRYEATADGTFVNRYEALGMGPVLSDDGELLVVVFVYRDAETATTNAALLEEVVMTQTSVMVRAPWSELLTIRSIGVDGRAVVGVFEAGVQSRLWAIAASVPESLVLWATPN